MGARFFEHYLPKPFWFLNAGRVTEDGVGCRGGRPGADPARGRGHRFGAAGSRLLQSFALSVPTMAPAGETIPQAVQKLVASNPVAHTTNAAVLLIKFADAGHRLHCIDGHMVGNRGGDSSLPSNRAPHLRTARLNLLLPTLDSLVAQHDRLVDMCAVTGNSTPSNCVVAIGALPGATPPHPSRCCRA